MAVTMRERKQPRSLDEMLDRIAEAADEEPKGVHARTIFELVGTRAYGPLLLLAGLIMMAPVIGDIPGVPTVLGLFVILISVQLFLHRRHFWLPGWLLNRSVSQQKVRKTVEWSRRPARYMDRLLRPRLRVCTGATAHYVIAAVGIIIAVGTPVMEFIPFTANLAGAALTAFGLAMVAHDGLFGLIAFVLSAMAAGLVLYVLF
jgi:hypothetical protein